MTDEQKRAKKRRAINPGPNSTVGQTRKHLYRHAIGRCKEALEDGYTLEAITLIESMMADRLESRLASLHLEISDKREFSTIGRLVKELKKECAGESLESKAMYDRVGAWSKRRNEALHELAKLEEDENSEWHEKYDGTAQTAIDGFKLFRELDHWIRGLKARTRRNKQE